MKKLIFGAALVLSAFTFNIANAQVKFSLNVNIGSQPDWGPVGYDHVEYYYMPDIDTYYYVPGHQYVFLQNNKWIHSASLPSRYKNYDVYKSYKVVINQPEPWRNQKSIRAKYAPYKGRHGQAIIRDSHDVKYRNHWNNNDNRGRGNSNGRGHAYGHR